MLRGHAKGRKGVNLAVRSEFHSDVGRRLVKVGVRREGFVHQEHAGSSSASESVLRPTENIQVCELQV